MIAAPAAGVRASSPAASRTRRRIHLPGDAAFLIPAGIFLAALSFYPFIELVRMSVSEVTTDNLFRSWPFTGWHGLQTVIATADFHEASLNTVAYVAVVVFIGLGGGLAAAVTLWHGGRLGGAVLAVMVFGWALPGLISGVAWRFLLDSRGPVDSLLSLFGGPPVYWLVDGHLPLVSVALVNAWSVVPFATIVFRAALLDISPEVLACATVDGARSWHRFRFIVLPLLRPVILVLGLLTLVYAFKSFDFIYIMTHGGPGTISTTLPFLSYRIAFELFKYSQGAAVALVTVLVVVLLALLYLRQLRHEQRA
ncbi:MAG: sugar ABC transporter permease [Chloroflexota bacterium]|nr:sugar ABC transporter permease [Chloroflexota bacterium]